MLQKRTVFSVFLAILLFLPAAPSADERSAVSAAVASVDKLAAELLAAPPDDLTRAEVAMALGWMHLFGMLGAVDVDKAVDYLEQARAGGLPEAGVVLGALYIGQAGVQGVELNPAKAIEYYSAAAEGGCVDAMRMLGIIYRQGEEGVPKDEEKAVSYLRKAAERGSEAAIVMLKPRMDEAVEFEKNNPGQKADFPATREELINPGLAAEAKQRSNRMTAVTAKVFDLVAASLSEEETDAVAAATSGGLPGDKAEVWRKLERAVEDGAREVIAGQPDAAKQGDAALIIGIFHYMGLLQGVDHDKAKEYLELALDKGVPEAGVTLGELYFGITRPDDADRDAARGMEYLENAAKAGSPDAERLLGLIYADGLGGVEKDEGRARSHFLAAARHGDPEALERLRPLFEQMAEWKKEHPGEKPPHPAGADEVVVPELARAAAERREQLGGMVDTVNAALEKKVMAVMQEGAEKAKEAEK